MKRFYPYLTMAVVVAPYLYIIPQFAEFNVIAYNIFVATGLVWGLVMSVLLPADTPLFNKMLTYVINAIAWPSCMMILGFSKLVLKRNALFIDMDRS